MASRRDGSKDTVERSTGDVVEQLSMSLPIYTNTHQFIDKYINITWKYINNTFTSSFEENMEDQHVYVNIHKSGFYKVAWRYPNLPCANVIQWIVSHTDPEMMILSSVSGVELVTYRTEYYQHIYHFPWPVNMIDAPFHTANNNENTTDILKFWVREPSKFKTTPN